MLMLMLLVVMMVVMLLKIIVLRLTVMVMLVEQLLRMIVRYTNRSHLHEVRFCRCLPLFAPLSPPKRGANC